MTSQKHKLKKRVLQTIHEASPLTSVTFLGALLGQMASSTASVAGLIYKKK